VTDAMDMFNAMRPPSPALGGDIRQSSSDLHNLAMVPGSPAYNQRIPKPPCWQCGEDHFPGRSYDHAWMAEPDGDRGPRRPRLDPDGEEETLPDGANG